MHVVIFKVILACYFQSNFLPVTLRPRVAVSQETLRFSSDGVFRRQSLLRDRRGRDPFTTPFRTRSPTPACEIALSNQYSAPARTTSPQQRPLGRALIKTEGFRRASQPRTRQMKLISPRRKPLHVICRSFKSPMMSRKFRQEMRFRI